VLSNQGRVKRQMASPRPFRQQKPNTNPNTKSKPIRYALQAGDYLYNTRSQHKGVLRSKVGEVPDETFLTEVKVFTCREGEDVSIEVKEEMGITKPGLTVTHKS